MVRRATVQADEGRPKRMKCRFCGCEVAHVRGVTGRITICPKCGWGRVELIERLRSLGAVAQLERAETGPKGWKGAGIS